MITAQVPSTVQARAQVERAAGSRWRRAPASAGARNFRVRRHLPLLGPRRRGELAKINARCAERAPQPPPARPSHPAHPTHGSRTFPPPCTAHAPPPCTPRFHLTRVCPCVCAGGQSCPSTSTRVEVGAPRRRDGGGAARAGREVAWVPRGGRSGEGGGVGARRRHLQGGQRWARKGHRTPVVSSFKHCDLFF